MRTTLFIDDEVVVAAKQMAQSRGVSLGQVISELSRKSLGAESVLAMRNGVRIFPPNGSGQLADLQTVNALRDDE